MRDGYAVSCIDKYMGRCYSYLAQNSALTCLLVDADVTW